RDTAHAADEVAVEKGNRGTQAGVQLGLPVSPIVPIQIAAGDAAAVVIEDVEIVSRGIAEKAFDFHLSLGVHRRQPPIEHSPGILGMALRIAAAGAIENESAVLLLCAAGVSELQAELRLADAGSTDHNGQRPGDQSTAQKLVKSGNARREARQISRAHCPPAAADLLDIICTLVLSQNWLSVPS